MKYFIYHIPGKKIGVTRNLDKRVTQQQGYAEEEYEVLFVSDDIDQEEITSSLFQMKSILTLTLRIKILY